ncbi:MAG: hypothetical protein ACK5Y2_04175 [Bdellovibrionales bacterium]
MAQLRHLSAALLLGFSMGQAQTNLSGRAECRPGSEGAWSPLFSSDFRWSYTGPELLIRFMEIYESSKRLPQRAYIDSATGQLKLPLDSSRGGAFTVPERFVQSVRNHIEAALESRVVEAVFFPDMGHSHLLIPAKAYDSRYKSIPIKASSRFYAEVFADPDLKVLYHTAEQLKTLDEARKVLPDAHIAFRHRTRNLVGFNNGSREFLFLQNPRSPSNTASELEDHYYYEAGFNLSAHKDGCLSYQMDGQTYHFDLSMTDLAPDPSVPVGYDYN